MTFVFDINGRKRSQDFATPDQDPAQISQTLLAYAGDNLL